MPTILPFDEEPEYELTDQDLHEAWIDSLEPPLEDEQWIDSKIEAAIMERIMGKAA